VRNFRDSRAAWGFRGMNARGVTAPWAERAVACDTQRVRGASRPRAAGGLGEFYGSVRERIAEAEVVRFDEIGMRAACINLARQCPV
jgi:hypothetical protein